jgi:hypothetical protein
VGNNSVQSEPVFKNKLGLGKDKSRKKLTQHNNSAIDISPDKNKQISPDKKE